jgi:dipeptidyl aminopeptidase/acylaminoacyl peptidase
MGGADGDDVLNLLPLLDRLPQADGKRLGMWGASRGGLLTYLALARTDRLNAAAEA